MAQQIINLGATGSGAGGDSARTAFEKAIANFAELYKAALPSTSAEKQAARDMFGLGTAATRPVQTSVKDENAQALLSVGGFSVGGTSITIDPAAENLTDKPTGGWYSILGAGSPFPVAAPIWNLKGTRSFALAARTKRAWLYTYGETPWLMELFHNQNILGTVSQSGGVPTGAIIERGSNGNGEYVRLADGTQICWRDFAPISVAANAASAAIVWTYPAGFTAAPVMMPCATANFSQYIDAALALCDNGPVHSQSSTRAILRNLSATARDIGLRVVAIGRWY